MAQIRSKPFGVTRQGANVTEYILSNPGGLTVSVLDYGCIILYSFPHCLPVKNRRVVVARNTLPARSTVVGNSGCEGLQG